MTKKQLRELLEAQTGSPDVTPGYNYVIVSVRTNYPRQAAALVKKHREAIEKSYKEQTGSDITLLPFGALYRGKSILVPTPFESSINVVAELVGNVLTNSGIHNQPPQWS